MQSQKVNSWVSICKPLTDDTVDFWDLVVRFSIVASLFLIFYFSISGRVFQPLVLVASKSHWSRLIMRPSIVWGAMGSLLLTFRTFLWFKYRPAPPADISNAPFLTVIIPAYNEGDMVENSIDSVAKAVYPSDRLEIIVVDDGSKDDTWKYIQHAAKRYPD
jgi:hyaluronan synthase